MNFCNIIDNNYVTLQQNTIKHVAMRRVIFCIFVMMSYAIAWAQTNVEPLLSDGKVWTMRHIPSNPYDNSVSYVEYRLAGETTINGMSFKKVQLRSWRNDEDCPEEWTDASFSIGQDGGKVYLHDYYSWVDDDFIYAVMDFSLKKGDTFQLSMTNEKVDFIVTEVSDTILVNSADQTPRKCFHLQRVGMSGWDEIWIEGIGSLTGGIKGVSIYLATGSYPNLMKCMENDKLLFEYSDATNIEQPFVKHSISSTPIYNLQGQRLTSAPRKGIYIQNGKKVVMK